MLSTTSKANQTQNQLNVGMKVSAVFLDLQKAFDSVSHPILLAVLEHHGIRGIANTLIESFLSGRTQQVRLDGTLSNSSPVTQGVVQGSTLGPLLFLIIINGIGYLNTKGRVTLYADDGVLLQAHKRNDDIATPVKEDMQIMANFFEARALSLNYSKTVFMVFHWPYVNPLIPQEIKISDTFNLVRVESFKYLGIFLDPFLTFSSHIPHLEARISSAVGALWKLKREIPIKIHENP